ncbi:HrpE/YscL family type III secretion apparatus protein [[Erwinia] mediterraneensis]|uniref:HrpE/YscL family type III secretion apparatus protein n=1 Tax=[Erwinia] mediterraneensis TaxID=2161819 RepID=UPI0010309039|nr:HrpE/YscL family type III secretion apparatus protein [[Erwinia] mediterraneensis]
MHNEMHHPLLSEAEEGVLISRAACHQHRRAEALITNARQQAKKIIAHAEREADQLRAAGWRQGFSAGFLSAAERLAEAGTRNEALRQRLQRELQNELMALLTKVLYDAAILPQLLSGWTQQLPGEEEDQTLILLLPEAWRQEVGRMAAALSAASKRPLRYEYHAEMRCVMKYRDSLAEFAPEEIAQEYCETLLQRKALSAASQQLTADYLSQLKEALTQRLDRLCPLPDTPLAEEGNSSD